MVHMLEVLRASGGSLRSTAVFDRFKTEGYAREADLLHTQASGETRFAKEVRFARLELVEAGLVQHSEDGVWSLSDLGWATFLNFEGARNLINRRRHKKTFGPIVKGIPQPTTGPVPTAYTASVVRTLDRTSWTYVFRYGETDLWKIGHTQNVATRLADVNRHLPVEVTAAIWKLYARQSWPESKAAYDMEQRLFAALASHRTQGERVRCDRECLTIAWSNCRATKG